MAFQNLFYNVFITSETKVRVLSKNIILWQKYQNHVENITTVLDLENIWKCLPPSVAEFDVRSTAIDSVVLMTRVPPLRVMWRCQVLYMYMVGIPIATHVEFVVFLFRFPKSNKNTDWWDEKKNVTYWPAPCPWIWKLWMVLDDHRSSPATDFDPLPPHTPHRYDWFKFDPLNSDNRVWR